MPSHTEKQRQAMAIAEHHPEKLHKRNRGMLSMSHKQLHEFASSVDHGFYGHFSPQGLKKGIHTSVIHHSSGGY